MKATEIVEKLKSVLLSSEEDVQEIEVQEEVVELAEDDKAEAAPSEEAPVEDEMNSYVKRAELESAISEVKAMYDSLMEKMNPQEDTVPQELSSQVEEEVKKEVKEELSSEVQEEVTEPLVHTPEEVVQSKQVFKYSENRRQTTKDVVFNKIFG